MNATTTTTATNLLALLTRNYKHLLLIFAANEMSTVRVVGVIVVVVAVSARLA